MSRQSAGRPSVGELFGRGDSDDERQPKRRDGGSAGAGAAAERRPQAPAAPAPPADPKVREAADKLAAFVAANGRHYEDLTRERNPGNTTFSFLQDKGSSEYQYYLHCLAAAGGGSTPAAPSGSGGSRQQPAASAPPPSLQPQPQPRKRSRWDSGGAAAAGSSDPAVAVAALAAHGARSAAAAAAAGGGGGSSAAGGGGTLSAMEQYMQRLQAAEAAKKQEEVEEEERQRRRAAQPLLKETAFDRRKVVAVYREDGQRGHHMGDYIPKEELAKFMAQCGDTQLQKQVEAESAIGADNIGRQLLQKMGWKEGKGIGAKEDGRTAPVAAGGGAPGASAAAAAAGVKQDTLGLGAQAHGAVEASDDPYEQFRKRMMLGYKYRPNPLGNPRKPYY